MRKTSSNIYGTLRKDGVPGRTTVNTYSSRPTKRRRKTSTIKHTVYDDGKYTTSRSSVKKRYKPRKNSMTTTYNFGGKKYKLRQSSTGFGK